MSRPRPAAPFEDSGATGSGGNQADASAVSAGAVYLYWQAVATPTGATTRADRYANRRSLTTRAISSRSRSSCNNSMSCSIAMLAMRQSTVLRTVTPAARHAP